jgi:hypothetical protein
MEKGNRKMGNIVTFSQANLPSVQSLSTALRALEKDVPPAGIVNIKMDKTGHWVYGADQTEVEDDATWAVNPFSFIHGYIAWGDGEVLGEKMVAVSQPLPELEAAPPNAKKGWEVQVGLAMKCITGEDKVWKCDTAPRPSVANALYRPWPLPLPSRSRRIRVNPYQWFA